MPTNFEIEYSQTESTICPYCHTSIPHEDQAMRCAECDSVYHEGCWAELDKCAQFGCESTVAHAVSYRTISDDGSQSRWLAISDESIHYSEAVGMILAMAAGLFLGFLLVYLTEPDMRSFLLVPLFFLGICAIYAAIYAISYWVSNKASAILSRNSDK